MRQALTGLPALTLALAGLALSGCRNHDFPQFPANYREYAYVTNGDNGTVTVLDVVNVRLDREVAVGQNPVAVAASPARNEVYVVNSGSEGAPGSISVIDAEKNAVAATITLHRKPMSIDLDSQGTLAYVANSESNSISVVDLKLRREIAQIGAGEEPVAARITSDGKTLVVANRRGNSVSVIDAAARRVRSIFDGCAGAADVVIMPDSSKAFVACSGGHQVMAIALANAKASSGEPDRTQGQPQGQPQIDRLESLLDVAADRCNWRSSRTAVSCLSPTLKAIQSVRS